MAEQPGSVVGYGMVYNYYLLLAMLPEFYGVGQGVYARGWYLSVVEYVMAYHYYLELEMLSEFNGVGQGVQY